MKTTIIYMLLIIILSSCSCNNEDDKSLYSLYRQKIEHSNYALYDFAYSGGFVTSNEFVGLTILKADETFAKSKIDKLPGSYFITKPEIGSLKLVNIENNINPTAEKDTLLTPKAQYVQIFNGVAFNIIKYNETYGSATMNTGLMRYEFDGLKETKDSLIFFKVRKIFGGRTFSSTAFFLKGNIKVVDSNNHNIIYVQISQAIIERGNVYKPKKPFKVVPNQPIVGTAIYEFYPKTAIKSTMLTDFGLWKRIK